MKFFKLTVLIIITFSVKSMAQNIFPVEFRVEKQSMSTPMTSLNESFFMHSYYARPVNIKFDGHFLNMYYDNKVSFVKEAVKQVNKEIETVGKKIITEKYYYTFNSNVSDTIIFAVDHEVPYVQVILPTKNSKGEYIGYTSYKQYVNIEKLAMK